MRALMYDRYGDESVLQLREVTTPAPTAGEVQIEVICASLNPVDFKLRNGMLKWLGKPTLPATIGKDFAGRVTALGAGVTAFAVGQRVFGSADSLRGRGACADMLLSTVDLIAAIPGNVSYETAACLGVAPGSALQALTSVANLQAGQRVLISGASGSVGAAGVQIAHKIGAHVTGVCSTANVDYVKSIGADVVIDYKTTRWEDASEIYDVILDTSGSHTAFSAARKRMTANGFYIDTFPDGARFVGSAITRLTSRQHCVPFMLKTNPALLNTLANYAAIGVLKPRIAQRIALEAVPQALRQMQDGKVQGKVCVRLRDDAGER